MHNSFGKPRTIVVYKGQGSSETAGTTMGCKGPGRKARVSGTHGDGTVVVVEGSGGGAEGVR